MQEIPRAILLPPPSHLPQRAGSRAVHGDSNAAIDPVRARSVPQAPAHGFLTLVDSRRDDTVDIKGKQFRFRPYNSRGTADGGLREADETREARQSDSAEVAPDQDEVSLDVLHGFGAGLRERNSSAFIASFITQERLSQGLHNPQFEAASHAYRRAGGSPSAVDNAPRLFSVAV